MKPSRTAQGVAVQRAVLTSMGVLDDPHAEAMLTPPMTVLYGLVRRWSGLQRRSLTQAGLAARVLWVDDQLTGALDHEIDQVAVVGAGYDSRAWRFRREGVRFFELDHPATQADKRRRAPGPGPTYVEADLRTDSAAAALIEGGLDASRPALFVVEGVTMYLTEEVVRRQFAELATSTAPGGRLVTGFSPPAGAATSSRQRRQRRLQRLARARSGETFRLTVDRAGAVALVESTGWQVTEAVGLRDAARALVPRASGLSVDAVSEHSAFVAAVRP